MGKPKYPRLTRENNLNCKLTDKDIADIRARFGVEKSPTNEYPGSQIKQAKAALDKHYASKFIELINEVLPFEPVAGGLKAELRAKIKELWNV